MCDSVIMIATTDCTPLLRIAMSYTLMLIYTYTTWIAN